MNQALACLRKLVTMIKDPSTGEDHTGAVNWLLGFLPEAEAAMAAEPDAWQEDTKPAGWRPKDDVPFFAHEAAGPWRPVSSSAIPDAEQRFIVLVTWERPLRKVSL